MANDNASNTDDLDVIERQLEKFDSTATNLETLSFLAAKAGKNQQANDLQSQATNLRVQQFKLYRRKQQIEADSQQWSAFVASLEVVNHFIDQSMDDLKQVVTVINAAAQLASIADVLLKVLAV